VGRAHWCGGGCGPCALVRWRRVLDTTIARQSTRAVAELLRTRRKSPTPATTPAKALGRSTTKPWLRRCSRPLTNGDTAPTHPAPEPARNSTSHLAPQADTGLTTMFPPNVGPSTTVRRRPPRYRLDQPTEEFSQLPPGGRKQCAVTFSNYPSRSVQGGAHKSLQLPNAVALEGQMTGSHRILET